MHSLYHLWEGKNNAETRDSCANFEKKLQKKLEKGKQFPWGVKLTDDDITWRAIRKLRRGEVFLI